MQKVVQVFGRARNREPLLTTRLLQQSRPESASSRLPPNYAVCPSKSMAWFWPRACRSLRRAGSHLHTLEWERNSQADKKTDTKLMWNQKYKAKSRHTLSVVVLLSPALVNLCYCFWQRDDSSHCQLVLHYAVQKSSPCSYQLTKSDVSTLCQHIGLTHNAGPCYNHYAVQQRHPCCGYNLGFVNIQTLCVNSVSILG